jgi:hypothetical protein
MLGLGQEHYAGPRRNWSYWDLPFGSYIVLEEMNVDPVRSRIHLVPSYDAELQKLLVQELQALWRGMEFPHWPSVIGHSQLELVCQPHDAISLV